MMKIILRFKIKNMIQAMIFDLDGTLVQTEKLKALSYARAAIELCPHEVSEEQVIEDIRMAAFPQSVPNSVRSTMTKRTSGVKEQATNPHKPLPSPHSVANEGLGDTAASTTDLGRCERTGGSRGR